MPFEFDAFLWNILPMDHQQEVKNMPFWRRWSNKRRHTSAECHASWQISGSVRSLQRWLHTQLPSALFSSLRWCCHSFHLTHLAKHLRPPLEPHMDTDTSGQHGLQTEVSKPCRFSSAFIIIISLPVSLFLWFFLLPLTGTGSFPAATLLPRIYSYILLHTSQ